MKQVARALLRKDDGTYLLVKHHKSDTWTLPWWHIEKWESLHKALKREIREEFNLKIHILWDSDDFGIEHIQNLPLPLAIYKIQYQSRKWWLQKKMEYIFHAEVRDISALQIQEKEIADHIWLTPWEIQELPNTFEQIPKLLEKIS